MKRAPAPIAALSLALLLGCGGSAAGSGRAGRPVAPRAAPALPPSPATNPSDAGWAVRRLGVLPLALELPEAPAWEARRDAPRWARLEHRASESFLEARLLRAERLVRPAECEARARLERPDLPRLDPEEIVETRTLTVPAGFRVELTVAVETQQGGGVSGYVLAFGASVGRCVALYAATRTSGNGAEAEIGRRLNLLAKGAVPTLSAIDIEDRVQPNALP